MPVLYWRINAGLYTAATGTSLGGGQYSFTFGAGVGVGDVVSYYIVAPVSYTHLDVYKRQVLPQNAETAVAWARRAAKEEGLLVGISSGAALAAAGELAARSEYAGKTIVVIIPSFGERYLSTILYADLLDA